MKKFIISLVFAIIFIGCGGGSSSTSDCGGGGLPSVHSGDGDNGCADNPLSPKTTNQHLGYATSDRATLN